MVMLALLLRRLPPEVADRLQDFADELSVGDDCRDLLAATRHLAAGSLGLAMADFERNGYETMAFERTGDGGEHTAAEYWAAAPHDAGARRPLGGPGALPGRAASGAGCGSSTGPAASSSPARPAAPHRPWPSTTGSTSSADYGTTVESELEVFGLISRATDDPRAFSLLAQVLGLFEAGYLQAGMGLFQMDVGHLSSHEEEMATRLGDALKRGAWAAWQFNLANDTDTGIDFLGVDWFEHAGKPVDQVRAEFFLVDNAEKSPRPWPPARWGPGSGAASRPSRPPPARRWPTPRVVRTRPTGPSRPELPFRPPETGRVTCGEEC